jgi:hypothetical protein
MKVVFPAPNKPHAIVVFILSLNFTTRALIKDDLHGKK